MRFPIGVTVTRIRPTPGGRDRYADPVAGSDVETPIPGCAVAPRSSPGGSSTELGDRGRSGVIVGLVLYAPAGTDLVHTDRIRHAGVVYEIEGDPGVWISPFTLLGAGVEVGLRRAVG